ncbi:hypothetical protein BDV93DRAFT_529927 [Ceratobasidium sp. AG-I]|nr:hypothetical protein BDV93DRAFT_529927 [Ceratobasidium sp. AG-I]
MVSLGHYVWLFIADTLGFALCRSIPIFSQRALMSSAAELGSPSSTPKRGSVG